MKLPTSESRLGGTRLSRTRPRRVTGPSRGDARHDAAYPREGPVANAFRSGEIYVPPTKSSGALWASCAAVVLRAHAHKRSRSNGAGMLHAVMCPSRTAHTSYSRGCEGNARVPNDVLLSHRRSHTTRQSTVRALSMVLRRVGPLLN